MSTETIRQKKIAELLQNEIASIFIKRGREIYPKVMLTAMKVRVSQDLSFAKVYVSIFPIKNQKQAIVAVKKFKNKIKHFLSIGLKNQLRKIPELSFYLDDSNEHYEKIDKILKGETDNPIS